MKRLLLLALSLSSCVPAQPASPPVVTVSEQVLIPDVPRLGVNLGPTTYYQDQQYVGNVVAHGGFSKGRQRHFIRVAEGTENSVRDEYTEKTDPDRHVVVSFEGGAYTIATGPRAGETGAITAHDMDTGTYTLEKSGTPIVEGDFLWLVGPPAARAFPDPQDPRLERGIGIGDFRVVADENVKLSLVDRSETDQALQVQINKFDGRTTGGVRHYLRATPLTTYTFRVEARSDAVGMELSVGMENPGAPEGDTSRRINFRCRESTVLSTNWTEYVFAADTGASDAIGSEFSSISVVVSADETAGEGATALLDNLRLESEHTTASGFLLPVVEALREAKVGTLRFYDVFDLGADTASFTARSITQAEWSFLGLESRYRIGAVTAVLDDCLRLAQEVDAEPWFTIGGANTPSDWHELVSYLCAPEDFDAAAERRAAHGYQQPWIDAFDTIYLEIGNEWWNQIFRPYYVWSPEKYAEICTLIADAVRSHPHFNKKIKIVAGGWAINAHHWNGIVAEKALGIDIVSIAPYLVHELSRASTPDEKWGSLFAGVESYMHEGGNSTLTDLAKLPNSPALAVYEINTHITGGSAPATAVSEITSSAAAGVGVLDQAMTVMSQMKAAPINYFVLLQRAFNDRLGLWGALIREDSGRLRPRPVWQALRLANQYLLNGDLVVTRVDHSPTFDHEENGSVPTLEDVPEVHAYAVIESADKRRARVLIINRSWTLPHTVELKLPFAHAAEATRIALAPTTPDQNNEELLRVDLKQEDVSLNAAPTVTLPPTSATVYVITER